MKGFDIYLELQKENHHFDWAVQPGNKNVGCALRMKKHLQPWSIKNTEFDFLYNTIIENNLKCGYEVATAFGISSLAAGLAFKQTGGKLVTMDAYIEEKYNDCSAYTNIEHYKPKNKPDGLIVTEYLIKKYNLEGVVFPEIGWSPSDTDLVLSKNFDLTKNKLDYIFIDAGHWDDAAIKDINSVIPYLSNDCHIFFHDIHCFTDKFFNHIKNTLGAKCEVVVALPLGFNLAKIKKC